MKTLSQYIQNSSDDELLESISNLITNEQINEGFLSGLFKKISNFFGSTMKTMGDRLYDNWKSNHPDWVKNYEDLKNAGDEKAARQKLDDQLALIDKDAEMDDKAKTIQKISVLGAALNLAQEKKFAELEKFCTEEIGKYAKSNPEEMKAVKAGETGEGGEEVDPKAQAEVEKAQKAVEQTKIAKAPEVEKISGVLKQVLGIGRISKKGAAKEGLEEFGILGKLLLEGEEQQAAKGDAKGEEKPIPEKDEDALIKKVKKTCGEGFIDYFKDASAQKHAALVAIVAAWKYILTCKSINAENAKATAKFLELIVDDKTLRAALYQ